MPGRIEIADSRRSAGLPAGTELAFDLIDLLRVVAPEGPTLAWAILDLWATLRDGAALPRGQSYRDLEAAVGAAPMGVQVEWDELLAVAQAFRQVIDGVFVGCHDPAALPSLATGLTPQVYAACDLVLEALDSTLWRVYAREETVLQRFRDAFNDVTEAPLP